MKQKLKLLGENVLIFLFVFSSGGLFAQNWNTSSKVVTLDRAQFDQFGISASVYGDFAIIGARYEDEDSLGNNTITSGGSAYIYQRNTNNTWTQIQKIVASDRNGSDQFGWAVSIDGDYIAVSSVNQDYDENGLNQQSDAGAVYIFENDGNNHWVEVQKLVASDRNALDWFGWTLDITGNRLIVGSSQEDEDSSGINTLNNSGAAYIFERDGGGIWTEKAKLVALDRGANDNFGYSVAIESDMAIVGARYEDEDPLGANTMSNSGSAYIFEEVAPGSWIQIQKLQNSDRTAEDYFGWTVAMHGNLAVIGAYGEDHDITGSNYLLESGSAYVFRKNSSNQWTEESKLVASDREAMMYFTRSISIWDSTIVIGAYNEDKNDVGLLNLTDAGAAYVFETYGNGIWYQSQKITSFDREANDLFGACVGIYQDRILIGANTEDDDSLGGNFMSSAGSAYFYNNRGVGGYVYLDLDQDCLREQGEIGLEDRLAIINPGNYYVQTNAAGYWHIDSLPIGTYSITIDTTGNWLHTCPPTQSFTVIDPQVSTSAPNFGMVSSTPCIKPNVSVDMPAIRPCFTNLKIFINVSNHSLATDVINPASLDLFLDTGITILSSQVPYTNAGNSHYVFNLGSMPPGASTSFYLTTMLSCYVPMEKTICIEADLNTGTDCFLDTIPGSTAGINPNCNTPYDQSSLNIDGWCSGDSIYFTVTNTGVLGVNDMSCYSPLKLFVDGQFAFTDSVLLNGGQTDTLMFAGDGRTWRLEALQHPLHPGNSFPNKTIERCGNIYNWTPGLFGLLPDDDFDSHRDIYCGIATSSYDPNDKTPYPTGTGDSNYVYLDQTMDYRIRFQNTGNDTAFTVVIRDTLNINFDIFSVVSGVSSHPYTFEIYGPRVLQWTFDDILLPDSTTNLEGSKGFVHFKVDPVDGSPEGTVLNNTAHIYFDYNEAIVTNTTMNVLSDFLPESTPIYDTLDYFDCYNVSVNGFNYSTSGTYYHVDSPQSDTVFVLNVNIDSDTLGVESIQSCQSYIWPTNGVEYAQSGVYSEVLVNSHGCDSTAILNLIIDPDTLGSEVAFACANYTWSANNTTYTSSGIYSELLQNSNGCDSMAILDLTIDSDTVGSETVMACSNYTWGANNITYASSGVYTYTLQNTNGCDSTATLYLTIDADTLGTETQIICGQYTWGANGVTYTSSGLYSELLQNEQGCDSTAVLELQILPESSVIQQVYACDSFTWIDGNTYTSNTNLPTMILTNGFGCDSTVSLDLIVLNSSAGVDVQTTCDSLTWIDGNTYTASNNSATWLLTNASGCDSIVTLDLTVQTIDNSVLQINDTTLQAIASGFEYQWLDCNANFSPLANGTSQSFYATQNGLYAVSIFTNECVDTSECFVIDAVDMQELSDLSITVAPNPTESDIEVRFEQSFSSVTLQVYDLTGRLLSEAITEGSANSSVTITLDEPSGVYILRVIADNQQISFNILKY